MTRSQRIGLAQAATHLRRSIERGTATAVLTIVLHEDGVCDHGVVCDTQTFPDLVHAAASALARAGEKLTKEERERKEGKK